MAERYSIADQDPVSSDWHAPRETAPSTLRGADPRLARWFGMLGLLLLLVGTAILFFMVRSAETRSTPLWGILFTICGVAFLLLHASLDADLQVRRTYGMLGYLWLGLAVFSLLPLRGAWAGLFLPYSMTAFVLGLLFLLPFARNETEPGWRNLAVRALGIVGAVMLLAGFLGGMFSEQSLLGGDQTRPLGILLIVLGIAYLGAFLGVEGATSDLGYRVSLGLGLLGLLVVLVALGRSLLPPLFYGLGWTTTRPASYFVPTGLVLLVLGSFVAILAACLTMENRFVVLFRREMAAYFYSPIAYIVLFSFMIGACTFFWLFVRQLVQVAMFGANLAEPVMARYLLGWFPVICSILAPPLLTMRLLSEEHRTGTLEVLLTAPLGEVPVVMSKFCAGLIFYLLIWAPWAICLLSFRIEGGQPFEYRPLLSFYLMILCTGAGAISFGLFCSSVTKNQIIALVLSFMGLLVFTSIYFAKEGLGGRGEAPAGAMAAILTHISYLDLFITSLFGEVTPKFYIFPLSASIFWLFLTTKVLEARRWL